MNVSSNCPACARPMDLYNETESLDGLVSDGIGFQCEGCGCHGAFVQYGEGDSADLSPVADEPEDDDDDPMNPALTACMGH